MCGPDLRWRNRIPSRETHIALAEAKGDVGGGGGAYGLREEERGWKPMGLVSWH